MKGCYHSARGWLGLGLVLGWWIPVQAADGPATFSVSEFTFKRPPSWEWVATQSPMRKAQLRVVSEDKKQEAEVIFFYFGPGGAGGVAMNVERWFSQFAEPREKISAQSREVKVGGHTVTYVSAKGTYQSGMPGGPKTPLPDHRLLGAILESPQGNVYVRLIAPISFAAKLEDDFNKMIEGALK